MADHASLFEPSRGERGGYEFRNGAGELLQAIDWNRAAESGWANTIGFYQPDLEATLEALAVATPGVTVNRGRTFQALTPDDEVVSVELAVTDKHDAVMQVLDRWLVGADGANRAVRTEVGIEVGDSGFEADWLVVDYQPLVAEKWSAFVTQYCDPAQPATAVSSGPGRRRFEFMRRADMTVAELGQESPAWRLMAPWGVAPETARLGRHRIYTFRGRAAATFPTGNALRAGGHSLSIASNGAEGRLAPQGRVQVLDRLGLFDDIVGGGWQLISRIGDPTEVLNDEELSWFRQIGGVVADVSGAGSVKDVDGSYDRWFAKHGCEAFLARPDFYVFAAGEHTDIPLFVSCLRQTLQSPAHTLATRRNLEVRS